MSETDSFIDEVTEEVRRDKLFAIFRKYGWIGAVLVVAIVGGAAWREWSHARKETAAEAYGDAIIAALANDDAAARVAALEAVAPNGADTGAQRAVVGLIAAGEAFREGDRAGALARFEALAADTALPADYRQLAQLKAVILAGPSLDPAARDKALAELAQPGAPYRLLAMEQQAVALVADGKTDEAIALARDVLQQAEVTPGLRRRMTQLIVILGGDPAAS